MTSLSPRRHCLLTWIQQESSKGLCPMCRQRRMMSFENQRAVSQSSTPRPSTTTRPSTRSNDGPSQATATPPDYRQGQYQTYARTQPDQDRQEHEPSPGARDGTPSSFRPFFTLIEDVNTSKFYHPTVHYVFSDDDTSLITEAAMRSLDQQQYLPYPSSKAGKGKKTTADPADLSSSSLYAGKLPPRMSNAQEHFIVLDIQPTATSPSTENPNLLPSPAIPSAGPSPNSNITHLPFPPPSHYKITSAHSLSPTWQVLNTHLTPTPTFDSSLNPAAMSDTAQPDSGRFPPGGLMLRVEGTAGSGALAGSKPRAASQGNTSVATGQQALDEMVDLFEKRMGELRKVVDASGYGVQPRGQEERDEGD
ncbi:anaphase promoting complex subunit 11 [Uncinocarpus reesii 1704]|uniref:Anaphase promoting complex subunit 11 n=1 Tax=Uncinocarpus reesii (strain UAMH 1704) TaxID=336963 RepID=C4JFP2_UNCRE|nr:anaphase promoting complex subunit 11 [Uncinocarpus reesii 1704]EEP77527.1 anaphase promoting complex subunit 11 [Uncinocarpus reesii 1704]